MGEHSVATRTVPDAAADAGRRWSPVWTVRLVQGALWLLVAAGPVAAGVALADVGDLRDRIATPAPPVPAAGDLAEVEGLAAVVGADHLTAAGWRVSDSTSLGAEEITPDLVVATVTAQVLPADIPAATSDDADAPLSTGRLFLTVAMAHTDAGWVATGPPSLVAGPDIGVLAETGRGERLETVAGLEDTVVRFLAAYLTADGEVERYTAPDAGIRPVTPAPFTTVEVTDAGVVRAPDGSLAVTVTVDGAAPSGGSLVVSYLLVVVERDGRFEVARVLPPLPAIPEPERGGSS